MTHNIILLFLTISSIWKCHFLNHTQDLYDITISSILFALLHYIIHVKFQRLPSLSSTALVVLRVVHHTKMNMRRRIAMKYFTIIVVFLLSKLHHVIGNVTYFVVLSGVIFSARVVWILHALSLEASLCVS